MSARDVLIHMTVSARSGLDALTGHAAAQISLHVTETIATAMKIADDAVRAHIEVYACSWQTEDGSRVIDTTRLAYAVAGGTLDTIQRALRYIELRGDQFPWQLKRDINAPHLVQFVEKEG